ncbi:Spy0128 family protein [Collinsella aerofaciens]|uniref:Spy0128 family protein n=1 Tax=Collinsella aerofaciens TaxID=74426 RepID=UPI001C02B678|nr:FctA domain-containing protein [Collinsella aerofaciens]
MSYGRRRGLRPVSPYVIVLALAVVLTASFFLPTRAEAKVSDHTVPFPNHMVPTISPSGTTINLFDYWVNSEDHLSVSGSDGINKGHRFKFKDQGASDDLNRYTGGSSPRSGIVNNVLTGGYPKLTDSWGGESLGYLFDSSAQTGKISHMGVTGLLQAKGGYYEYDSSKNYAAYNVNKNAFDVYEVAGVGQAGAGSQNGGQFFPFDAADKVFKEENGCLVRNGITSSNNGDSNYNDGKPLNHYFGLSMSSRFVQPTDGKTNAGDPMTFEFAGDDDVWVFIDDVLVGDIGGIHTSAKLTIDFQTGEIKVNDSPNGTLLRKFQEAGRGTSGFTGNTFANDTSHTLKFFYLERGATDSNMKLKYNLVTVPESDIIKFDQDGGLVEGAQFELYKTDKSFADTTTNSEKLLGSGTTDANGQLTLTNKVDNGVINFDDLYSKDHNCRYYLLKETKVPEGHRSSLTATDGSMQFEYVPASDENRAGGVIINRGGMDADSSVWQSGAFAGSKETITAPSTVYQADDDSMKPGNTVDMKRGTLFAVVFKRDKSKNAWHAVSGDPTKGYTLAGAQGMAGAIEAAKKDLYAFTLNTSGQYQVEIPYLPGDISKYYYLLSGDARKNAEYAVAIYYTTASSIADANTDNTVHVFSDDLPGDQVNFKRQFATSLLVTNIQNRLFVQKTDTEGNPVDGAKFGLYTDGQVTTDANGKVVLNGDQIPYDTLTTGQVSNPIQLEGAGIFPCTSDGNKPLVKGAYFLKEVSAPKGFLLNDTLTKVIVDDYGVHADAGTADDGVSTFVGPGTLMKSLGQFGAEGDIDNTFTWIKGMRQTSDGVTDGGNLSWSDVDSAGAGDTVHLKYGANGRIYQYGPTKAGEPYRLETETGWIRMGITQDEPGVTNAKGARADLGDMNLNALFTGATCVRVANEREASLEVTKKVDVPDGLTGNKDAGFTFNFTVPAGKTYKAAVFEKAGTAGERRVGNVFNLTNGYSQTIKADETIRVYGLSEGDEYTVQELTGADQMPAGYKLTGRKQGATDLKDAGDSVTGKIAKQNTDGTLAEANKLVFTNSYSVKSSVTLTGIKAKKKFTGREWTSADSFELCLRAADGTPMPDGATAAPVAGMKQVEKTVTSAEEFSFGEIKYEKPGEYTYYIAETTPAKSDPSWLGGVSYSSAEYKVTVTVKDDGKGNLTEPVVKMEQIYKDDGTATSQVIDDQIAVITNTYRPKETSVTLKATKRFTGGELAGNDFTFQLLDGDGSVVQTVQNEKDGKVAFAAIDYATPGDHDYTIKEVKGADSTVVYDAKGVKVHVKVTDEKGELKATVTYDGEKAVPTFTNTKPTADVTVEATKVLAGKDLTADAFTFGLYDQDGNEDARGTNDKNGKVKLTVKGLNLGEYDYTLKEVAGSDSTITYDSTEVRVHVSVKAEGDKAKATVTYDGKNDIPTFKNTYQPAETSVTLAAKKAYVKSDSTPAALKGGEFAFDLYEGDLTAEQLKGKQPIRSAKNGEDGTVTFPAINYTKAGEYKYTIVEKKGDLSHVTFDDAVHHAAVKVMDKAGKLDAAVAYDGDKADAPTFTNTYTAKGSVELTATKVVAVAPGFTHDTKLKGGEYTFELKDADGKVLDTAKNEADGTVKFTRDFELADLGGAASKAFAYTIVEQPGAEPGMVYDNHTLTYTVTVTDGGNGALNAKAIVTSASGSDTFTNTYQPAATGLALGAQKSYVKKDDNTPIVPKDGEFTFDVYEGKMTAEQLAGAKPVRTATNGADGSVNFDAFSYAKPGTYEYTIVERKGDLAYVTYDDAVHHAVVTVVDNAGTLQASVAYDGADATKPTFTNTYKAKATNSGAIALTKSVDVHDGSYQLKAGDFAFELVGSDGTVLQTQKNDAKGKVYFNELTFDHAGTFPFTVREVQPTDGAPGVPGVTYTGKTYTLTYVVKDNNDGKLVVESSTVKPSEGTENGVTPNTMTFANSYQPGQTSYQISGTKVLENADPATTRTPADGEFTFALIDVATGQEIDRTTNVGKAFTFKAISYTATGSHAYQVKEVAGQDGTITYSDAVLDVTVNVTDDGSGQLTATANKTAADLTFTNTYTPTATTATITGTKALTGRDLAEGEFFFDLKDADGNVVQTVQNGADGTFGFAPLQLDKVGTYVYTVSERAGATANGVTYDTTVFTATVTVTENAETHALEAQVAYSKGGKAADAVAFSNSYAPAATEVKLGASKVLSGEDLKEGQFSFQLKDADGKVLQTAKNAADGTVGFEAISYDKPGTYAYSISEVDDGQKNVTYDAAEHRVTVTVTDDGAGHLVATVTYDGAVAPVFKNTYTPPTTPPTEPPTNPPSKSPVPKEEKPGLPYTGDTSLSPMALGGIAGGAVVLIAAGVILRRRNR